VTRRAGTALAVGLGATLAAAGAQDPQRPVFRAGAALIVVDVQVIGRQGAPVPDLAPDDFEVRIDRQPRRVVSAEFVRIDTTAAARPAAPVTPETRAPDGSGGPAASRTFVLAVDESSFSPRNALAAMQAARRFVEGLAPGDRIGVFKYPVYPKSIFLTTDHQAVLDELGHVMGVLDLPGGRYRLTLSEVVDITAGDPDVLARVVRRECGGGATASCRREIVEEAKLFGMAAEGQVAQSAAGLRALFDALADFPERKTVVIVSGGLLASDRVGGRPDVSGLISEVGERAARSNTNLYVLHLDTSFIDAFSATGGRVSTSLMRESSALASGLDRFAGIAGGALIRVEAGTGDYAFERVLRETSAYYLLSVEVEPADRDGRPHYISVSVNVRGADVRSRAMVVIPAGGG
jgi:VWFA-related protein